MSQTMTLVRLKNGAQEPDMAVRALMAVLTALYDEAPILLYDAAQVARRTGKPFGDNAATLREHNLLLPDGTMHDTTRNVILSALEGEGFEMVLVSPYAPEGTGAR